MMTSDVYDNINKERGGWRGEAGEGRLERGGWRGEAGEGRLERPHSITILKN